MRNKLFIFAAILILLVATFHQQLSTHLKIVLFISEQFPQIPVKPLGLVSSQPVHQKVELESVNGKIVADLFVPNQVLRLPSVAQDKAAALILAMGVKTSEEDKPLLMSFADTLARLGYVTFWPRLEILDKGESLPEEPETFIESFKYLANLAQTDSERITFVGFSAGSSTAFVASADPQIRNKVHTLIFFGGYYNIFDYILSLATKTFYLGKEKITWKNAPDAIDHAKGLLKVKGAENILAVFEAESLETAHNLLNQAPLEEVEALKKYSPHEIIDNFKADIFILHDKSDTYVPYVESVKLNEALSGSQVGAYHISDLFDHVQPNRPINIGELVKLYGFLYKVLSFI